MTEPRFPRRRKTHSARGFRRIRKSETPRILLLTSSRIRTEKSIIQPSQKRMSCRIPFGFMQYLCLLIAFTLAFQPVSEHISPVTHNLYRFIRTVIRSGIYFPSYKSGMISVQNRSYYKSLRRFLIKCHFISGALRYGTKKRYLLSFQIPVIAYIMCDPVIRKMMSLLQTGWRAYTFCDRSEPASGS